MSRSALYNQRVWPGKSRTSCRALISAVFSEVHFFLVSCCQNLELVQCFIKPSQTFATALQNSALPVAHGQRCQFVKHIHLFTATMSSTQSPPSFPVSLTLCKQRTCCYYFKMAAIASVSCACTVGLLTCSTLFVHTFH